MTYTITQQTRYTVTFQLPNRESKLRKTESARYSFDTEEEMQAFITEFLEWNS